MQASLAFLNSAGARTEASKSVDESFFQILNLLRTGHHAPSRAGRARRPRPSRSRSALQGLAPRPAHGIA